MAKQVEFRIQETGQSWEETVVTWQDLYEDTFWAYYAAQCAAQLTGKLVRWNWVDSSQGHYAYPDHIVATPLKVDEHCYCCGRGDVKVQPCPQCGEPVCQDCAPPFGGHVCEPD